MLQVKDVLTKKGNMIWSIGPEETVFRALEIMAEKDIGMLVVIEKGKMAGIFSERDYARKVILRGKYSKDTLVEELMTKNVYFITSDKSVEECLALMTQAHVRHMPVFEDNRLVGIVTIGDVTRTIIERQRVAISDLENYITGSGYVEVANP